MRRTRPLFSIYNRLIFEKSSEQQPKTFQLAKKYLDLHGMNPDDDFDSVSWRNDPESDEASRPTTSETDAEPDYESRFQSARGDSNGKKRVSLSRGDDGGREEVEGEEGEGGLRVDPAAGILEGVLECSVDTPMKENDGTKDAYVSYLVTTHVGGLSLPRRIGWNWAPLS